MDRLGFFSYRICCFLIIGAMVLTVHGQEAPSSPPTGPYLGQTLPGAQPSVFAAGLVSDTGDRLHGAATFSPDGKVVCWSVIPPAIKYRVQQSDGTWSETATIPLKARGVTAAQFAPDGRLWFQGVPLEGGFGGLDLGFVSWDGNGWSAAMWPGTSVNSEGMDSTPSCTAAGDIYLTAAKPGKVWNRGLYHIPYKDGYFQPREYLPAPFNDGDGCIDYTVFVDPDGRYLVWSSSRPTANEGDLKLYVSHRDKDGTWGQPVNLSRKLGLQKAARFPFVSADGRCLFFLMDGRIWWVDARVLTE